MIYIYINILQRMYIYIYDIVYYTRFHTLYRFVLYDTVCDIFVCYYFFYFVCTQILWVIQMEQVKASLLLILIIHMYHFEAFVWLVKYNRPLFPHLSNEFCNIYSVKHIQVYLNSL
ncbi:hypothetical protein BDB01DRAFT_782759 [Pilobolus umbonatus]|nr:hypothetical protein BDB01DRAFT_782759 [Pilobolus umbonatus]